MRAGVTEVMVGALRYCSATAINDRKAAGATDCHTSRHD